MITFLLWYSLWAMISFFVCIANCPQNWNNMFFSPMCLYKKTKMNVFGCILTSAILVVVFPIWSILATVAWCIYQLTHIGRKAD